MSEQEIVFFSNTLGKASIYLEYGSGGSTKAAARCQSITSITSVESDPDYVEKHVLDDQQVQESVASGRLKFILVDIGPTGDWGRPKDRSKTHLWPNYALSPHMHGPKPNLILIDGRFRVACSLVSMMQAPEAVLLIHDYTVRREYHLLERFLTITDTVDTLVCCRRSDNFNELKAKKIIQKYLYEPDDDPITLWKFCRRQLSKVKRRLIRR
jgi:hypothetical protein